MSDGTLVERVARAIMVNSHSRNFPLGKLTEEGIAFSLQRVDTTWEKDARAAIRAVASYFDTYTLTGEWAAKRLLAEFDPTTPEDK